MKIYMNVKSLKRETVTTGSPSGVALGFGVPRGEMFGLIRRFTLPKRWVDANL